MRTANVKRKTKETDIKLDLNLDGTGVYAVDTSIPFFDHMLTLFAVHGFFDLDITATGDLEVDFHHTVEDVGLVDRRRVGRERVGDPRDVPDAEEAVAGVGAADAVHLRHERIREHHGGDEGECQDEEDLP